MKVQYKTLLASILLVLVSFVCSAQLPDPPPPATDDTPPPGLPIDGASSIVLILGALYGAHKGLKGIRGNTE